MPARHGNSTGGINRKRFDCTLQLLLTYEQREWLKDQATDRRIPTNEFVRGLIRDGIRWREEHPEPEVGGGF